MNMKMLLFLVILLLTTLFTPSAILAQSDNHTAREEKEGKVIWEKLQTKEVTCDKLSNENFGALGEYFMRQMVGSSHEAMNTMMEQMMGKDGEEQMHVIMGKRLSGCDISAQFPQSGLGFMPMMWMMRGGENPMMGTGWGNMMDGWNGLGFLGLIFWIVLLVDSVLLGLWLWKQLQKK